MKRVAILLAGVAAAGIIAADAWRYTHNWANPCFYGGLFLVIWSQIFKSEGT